MKNNNEYYSDLSHFKVVPQFERPEIKVLPVILNITLPIFIDLIISLLFYTLLNMLRLKSDVSTNIKLTFNYTCMFFFSCVSIYFFHKLKDIAIWTVKLYQRFSPAHIRMSCVFQPTCSDYMILSIKKYGLLRGVIKGIRRLLRCKYPNGGIDYP